MATWITRVKDLVDLTSDDSIALSVWKGFASMVYAELWAEVSLGAGRRYFETSTSITATGAASYSEPTDHMSTIRVVRVDGNYEYEIRELRANEEPPVKGSTGIASTWALVDDQLFLYPVPSSGTYKWYYQQQPSDISIAADADLIDVVLPAGEAFFLWGIGVLALGRQQKNTQLAVMEREKARERLQFEAAQRSFSEPITRGPEPDDEGALPGDWPYR